LGISSGYGNPARTHSFKAKPSAAARPSAGEKRGVRVPPSTKAVQLARTPIKAKPSAAARPSAAEKRGVRGSPDYGNPTRTHAEEKPKTVRK
jgi:hypothetical protein